MGSSCDDDGGSDDDGSDGDNDGGVDGDGDEDAACLVGLCPLV